MPQGFRTCGCRENKILMKPARPKPCGIVFSLCLHLFMYFGVVLAQTTCEAYTEGDDVYENLTKNAQGK